MFIVGPSMTWADFVLASFAISTPTASTRPRSHDAPREAPHGKHDASGPAVSSVAAKDLDALAGAIIDGLSSSSIRSVRQLNVH